MLAENENRERIEAICLSLSGRCDELALASVRRIRVETARAYSDVDLDEHRRDVARQYAALLDGIAHRREPRAAEIRAATDLGSRRADQGVQLKDVVSAYQLGYESLWDAMVGEATGEDGDLGQGLLPVVGLFWRWVQVMSAAAASGFSVSEQSAKARRRERGRALIERVRSSQTTELDFYELTLALPIDPTGHFQGAMIAGVEFDEVAAAIESSPLFGDDVLIVPYDRASCVVVQRSGDIEALTASVSATAHVGIGVTRTGLAGLRLTLDDAEMAVSVALQRGLGSLRFDDGWQSAVVLHHARALRHLLDLGEAAARSDLRETVESFARSGFSLVRSAQQLHVHPNTVKYRLERWADLTGWDPRTVDGLINSLAALELHPGVALERSSARTPGPRIADESGRVPPVQNAQQPGPHRDAREASIES